MPSSPNTGKHTGVNVTDRDKSESTESTLCLTIRQVTPSPLTSSRYRKLKTTNHFPTIYTYPIENSDVRNDVKNYIRNDVRNDIINDVRNNVGNYVGIDVGNWDRKRRNFSCSFLRSLPRRSQNLFLIYKTNNHKNSSCYYFKLKSYMVSYL